MAPPVKPVQNVDMFHRAAWLEALGFASYQICESTHQNRQTLKAWRKRAEYQAEVQKAKDELKLPDVYDIFQQTRKSMPILFQDTLKLVPPEVALEYIMKYMIHFGPIADVDQQKIEVKDDLLKADLAFLDAMEKKHSGST